MFLFGAQKIRSSVLSRSQSFLSAAYPRLSVHGAVVMVLEISLTIQ